MAGEATTILNDITRSLGGTLAVLSLVIMPSTAANAYYVSEFPTEEKLTDYIRVVASKKIDVDKLFSTTKHQAVILQSEADRKFQIFFVSDLSQGGAIKVAAFPNDSNLPSNNFSPS